MYAYNVSAGAIKELAEQIGFEAETENEPVRHRVRFTLKNKSPYYWSISRGLSNSDRVLKTKVCFHGHYHFLSRLFLQYPDAEVEAGWYQRVRYNKDNFEELAEEVGNTVIRKYDQLRARDKCDCES